MMQKNTMNRNLRAGLRIGVAGMTALCTPFIVGMLWILNEDLGVSISYAKFFLGFSALVILTALAASLVVPARLDRIIFGRFLFGIMLFFLLIWASVWSLAFFISIRNPITQIISTSLISVVALVWCWHSVTSLKKRMIERRFVEKEFSIEENKIVMRTPPKTDLDPPPIKKGSMTDKAGGWFFSKLIFLISIAYPLQRLLSNTGGVPAVLLLLSILGLPLTIYILGRMASGFYLWIYTVWKLEKLHGKPVVFSDID